MAKKDYPYIGIYVDTHDPNIIRADMLDLRGGIVKSAKAICNSHDEKFNFRKGCEIAFNRLFYEDYVHPTDVESQNNSEKCDECTQNNKEKCDEKPKFKVGDNVRVVDYGEHYSCCKKFVETYCPHYTDGFINNGEYDGDFNHNGATGVVVYNHINSYKDSIFGDGQMLYMVCFDKLNADGSHVYGIYNGAGIEKL